MSSWPAYATLLRDDAFGFERESALLRTDTESGPPKQTKIKSRVMVKVPVRARFGSQADALSFIDWVRTTLDHGTDWFDWANPLTGTTVQARIVGGQLGRIAPVRGMSCWEIPMTLEYWDA